MKRFRNAEFGMRILIATAAGLAFARVCGAQDYSKSKGTTQAAFKIGAATATPLTLTNASGALSLTSGLTVSGGTVNFSGATLSGFGTFSTIDIDGGTIDGTTIGGTTRGAGSFTSLAANNGLTVSGGISTFAGTTISDLGSITTVDINGGTIDGATIGGSSRGAGSFTSLAANNGLTVSGGTSTFAGTTISDLGSITTADINGGTIDGATIGGSSRGAGSFTSLAANNGLTVSGGTVTFSGATTSNLGTISGQIVSSLAIGTAPFSIISTTLVSNLNVDKVDGFDVGGGSNGGVLYRASSSAMTAMSAGTSGQFLISGGSSAPTFGGLTSAHLFIGNSSDIPVDVAISGDMTLNNAGVLNVTVGVAQEIPLISLSVGGEISDQRIVTIQVKDLHGNSVSNYYLYEYNVVDSLTTPAASSATGAAAPVANAWFEVTTNRKGFATTDSGGQGQVTVSSPSGAHTYYLYVWIGGKPAFAVCTFT